jgi:transposase
MIKITIDQKIQEQLFSNILYEVHHKTRLKNFVLYMKSFDFEHKDICKICRITKPTLTEYLNEYKDKGIDNFKTLKWKGQPSKLNDFKSVIDKDFENNPPKTINESQERIEKLTGIKRSPTQVRLFLKGLKYKYLKMGSIPGNGDGQDEVREETRQEFKKKNWNHAWMKQKEENG